MNADEKLKLALDAHKAKNYADAEAMYTEILTETPNHPDALHFLGLLFHQQGEPENGAALIEKSLSINPNHPSALNNLGNIYRQLGDNKDALRAYWAAVQANPAHTDSWNNMGVVYRNLNDPTAAEKVLKIASAFGPLDHRAKHTLVMVQLDLRNFEAAETLSRELIRDDNYKGNIAILFASALDYLGKPEEALRILLEWQKKDPSNPIIEHQVKAQRGDPSSGASEVYIRQTFDDFAESFEGVLQGLEYNAPALLAETVFAQFGDRRIPRAVDLGCGTGLLGRLMKPRVDHLTGVDLSPNMLLRARSKDVYDELVEAEIGAFLRSGDAASLDLVTAAEVLNYSGDLNPVFDAIARSLKPGGIFIATYEILEDEADTEYRLTPTGRYIHNPDYVLETGGKAGFVHRDTTRIPLRKHFNDMVDGLVITFSRAD